MADVPLSWAGGTNQLVDPMSIADNQVIQSKNSFPSLEGLLDKREPVRGITTFLNTSLAGYIVKPTTLFVPDPVLGLDLIIHGITWETAEEWLTAVNFEKLTTPLGGLFNIATGGLNGPVSFVNYRGRVIAVSPGLNGFAQLNKRDDGSLYWTQVTFSWLATAVGVVSAQSQAIPVYPRVVTVYRGRLVFANFGPGMGHWIVFADRNTQTNWTNIDDAPPWAVVGPDVLTFNGKHVEIQQLAGDEIIGMAEVGLQAVGSPLTVALLINGRRNSMIGTGEIAQTTDTNFSDATGYFADWIPNRINFDCGQAGVNAICRTPYGHAWAADDEVWILAGNLPHRVGTLIRPTLRSTPPALRKYWSMAYANGFLFLALCTQSSIDERQLRIQHWRLDLRNGVPPDPSQARWWGPQDYENIPAQAGGSFDTGVMASSIVSKREIGDSDTLYGAVHTQPNSAPLSARTSIVSFNQSNGGDDYPFPIVSSGRVWTANEAVAFGDVVRPTITRANGRIYTCITAGVTSGAEPTWPTASGVSVGDGTANWSEIISNLSGAWNRLPSFFSAQYPSSFAMDVIFKDIDFGQGARDKVIRRADISAYLGFKSLVSLRTIQNQGAIVRILGPVPMGDSLDGANDLGIGNLDTEGMVQEYQSRSLRPGVTSGRLAADPLTGYTSTDTGGLGTGGVIRGRSIQSRFSDDAGIVIDDTNNYISWLSVDTTTFPAVPQQVFTAALTNGRYANVDALMAHIVAVMNTAQGIVISGFTISANPWNYDSAFTTALYPYMSTFTFNFGVRTANKNIAFLFGLTVTSTMLGTTCYPIRTRRLLSLLGFDTSEAYSLITTFTSAFADGSFGKVIGEQFNPLLGTPTRICGIQSIPYTRSPYLSLSDININYYIKPGLPFSKRAR